MIHQIFDIALSSNFPLPGLPELAVARPDWNVVLENGPNPDNDLNWFHQCLTEDGREIMSAAREGETYTLYFQGLAHFSIDFPSKKISIYPEDNCPRTTLAHLLMDQVMPRVLCHQGRVVIHASAIALADGRALAFTGPSGRGKSTLALAMQKAGFRLLSDDCLLLERRESSVMAIPAYASVRLWPDSLEAMLGQGEAVGLDISEMAHYTSKKQVFVNQPESIADQHGHPLVRVFSLAPSRLEPPEPSKNEDLRVDPVSGSAAIMTLIESLFALDVKRKSAVRRSFDSAGKIAAAVPVFSASYPRDFKKLPQLVSLLTKVTN